MHNEMKTAMDSKIHSMEALIQEKTQSLDRLLVENEQFQHKNQSLESRLSDNQSELTEANKKYDDLHQNFVQRVSAFEYIIREHVLILISRSMKRKQLQD